MVWRALGPCVGRPPPFCEPLQLSENEVSGRRARRVFAAALLSLGGMLFHNWWDLPQLTPFSPENSGPTLVFVLLIGVWWARPHSPWTSSLLLLWGSVHLLGGGILSVIPSDLLPFHPEQSLRHYLGHLVYGCSQIPLIMLTTKKLFAEYRGGEGAA